MDTPMQAETDQEFPSKILPQLATRGDIAAAGIGLALGYFGDVLLLHLLGIAPDAGIRPGAASVYCSSAVLGLKNAIQVYLESEKAKRAAVSARNLRDATLSQNCTKLAELIETEISRRGDPDKWKLKVDADLFARGLIGGDVLEKSYQVALNFYQRERAAEINRGS